MFSVQKHTGDAITVKYTYKGSHKVIKFMFSNGIIQFFTIQ